MPISAPTICRLTPCVQATPAMVARSTFKRCFTVASRSLSLTGRWSTPSSPIASSRASSFSSSMLAMPMYPAACCVLSLAGLKEGLLVGTVQGEDDEVEALAPHEKLGGHAIADHLELMIGPFRPQHALDQTHGLGVVVQREDGFGGRRVSPFKHSGQLQAVDRRDHVDHVQPSFAGDVPEGAGAVQQRVDFDLGIGQTRPVGVAASSRLASEDELP